MLESLGDAVGVPRFNADIDEQRANESWWVMVGLAQLQHELVDALPVVRVMREADSCHTRESIEELACLGRKLAFADASAMYAHAAPMLLVVLAQ